MLVQADRQHPGVVVERGLDAIAVVDVDVDVGDAFCALVEQPLDRDRGVVVNAEAAGVVGHRVVQAAGDVDAVVGFAFPYGPGCGQSGARDQSGRVVHAREDRVVRAAEPVAAADDARVRSARALDHLDVAALMDQLELGVGGRVWLADRHTLGVEHPEFAGQPHGQLDPDRSERVRGPEVVADQAVSPGDECGAGHLDIFSRGVS